ncbi:hypothetical protein P5780_27755, partial [Bacillus cereus]|nr:hypothetical protein [Bacillus cereus]
YESWVLVHAVHCDEAKYKVARVLHGGLDIGGRVGACCETALGAHFSEEQQAALQRKALLRKTRNDARPWNQVRICHVRPAGDPVDARCVLQTHSVSNIGKLAVLKDEEIVLHAKLRKPLDEVPVKVLDNVNVRLLSATPAARTLISAT